MACGSEVGREESLKLGGHSGHNFSLPRGKKGKTLKFASSNIESSFLLCCARYHVKKFSSSFHRHSPSFDPKVGAAGILPIKGTIEAWEGKILRLYFCLLKIFFIGMRFKDGSCWLLDSRVVKSCCKQFSNPRNSSKIVVVGHRGGLKTEKSESRVSKTLQVGEWKRTLAIKMLATDKLQKVNSEEQRNKKDYREECLNVKQNLSYYSSENTTKGNSLNSGLKYTVVCSKKRTKPYL